MYTTSSRFETPNGSRYLQQLCKHFGHKIPAKFDETSGRLDFAFGMVTMGADEGGLDLVVHAEDEEGIDRGRQVMESHLKRFAFREEMGALDWSPATETA